MSAANYITLALLLTLMLLDILTKKLTIAGSVVAGLTGYLVFLGAGLTGICMISLFFLLGNLVTSWRKKEKEYLGTAEKNAGRRTAGQVLANGGVAAVTGLLSWIYPAHSSLFILLLASSLSAATADTISSELGTLYGKKFYNILSLKPDRRGENGVISLEGTIAGLAGSVLIAVVYSIGYGLTIAFCWIVIAGTVGNLTDSVLGATLERKHRLNNDAVNTFNTLAGALMAWLLWLLP